ncbi:pantoate--beta-alanine ligase [Thalassobacillus pellis]|uniref:pantoate--beta-alanine ligase n=1 Tax=Thalassobacillus pellis TaxID=748008 RepID=UPI001960CEC8|nr:pantoate--beta-alanine ligase [Thalassobacillus pellis]
MKVIHSPDELQEVAISYKNEGKTIGFVPTMGFLHEGHEKLIEEARKENDIVLLSIFVNPLQFGPHDDLDHYPRDEQHDRKVASRLGVDLLFHPDVESMYPHEPAIKLTVIRRTDVLCGRSRPGHFDGVVTVLAKLFHLGLPTRVYFGMKDAQQVAVVDGLIKDFHFPVELVPVPTVREPDGLAKSSRNVNLSAAERKEAPFIHKGLVHGKVLIQDGCRNPEKVNNAVKSFIEKHTHGKIDYIEILSYPELESVASIKGRIILAAAVKFNKARLIDNLVMEAGD